MCPHGYHHNGFMATPALGTQDVRLHIAGEDCIMYNQIRTYLSLVIVVHLGIYNWICVLNPCICSISHITSYIMHQINTTCQLQ